MKLCTKTKVDNVGRILLPSSFRKAAGINLYQECFVSFDDQTKDIAIKMIPAKKEKEEETK